jgi:DNA polymerase IV (DinB-like DNA polymerase)
MQDVTPTMMRAMIRVVPEPVMPQRIIAHLDMDAFFAAVEERERPQLKGLPIAVGADPMDGKGRGVVSTANYPARVYGLHSAMPITQAWRRSEWARRQGKPAVVFLRPNFVQYTETSGRIRAIVEQHAATIQQAGIDELYMDLSATGSYERAREIAQAIKRDIAAEERLTASIGLGPNKLIAKIASDANKPDGLTVVEAQDVEAFLAPLSVRKIPGIGPKTEAALRQQHIIVVQDLKRFSEADLVERFGKWGRALYERVRGRDEDPVQETDEVKLSYPRFPGQVVKHIPSGVHTAPGSGSRGSHGRVGDYKTTRCRRTTPSGRGRGRGRSHGRSPRS